MRQAGAWILLVLLVALALQKAQAGALSEMLWICHLMSAALALGLLMGVPALAAAGFLFHVSVAVPAFIVYLLGGGHGSAVSIALHVLTPALGWLAWRNTRLPGSAATIASGCYLMAIGICLAYTPPSANINFAFKACAPLAFLGPSTARIASVLLVGLLLATVQWLLHRRHEKT